MLLKWKVLPLWIAAACVGTGIAVHTLGDDALPPLPPFPGQNPQTPTLTPPQNVPPRERSFESAPLPTNPSTPMTPVPTPDPRSLPVPQSEAAPLPSEIPSAAPAPAYGYEGHAQRPRGSSYQPNNGVDPSLFYAEAGTYGGNYPNPVGSPYYHQPNWNYSGGNGYDVHFGPGYYRSGEYGHLRYPFYSYRRPWFHPGPAVYVRDTNLHW